MVISPEKTLSVGVDHDGTLTDSVQEDVIARELTIHYLSQELNLPQSELATHFSVIRGQIKNNPADFAWVMNGYRAAPATADHFQLNQAAARMTVASLLQTELPVREAFSTKFEGKMEVFLLALFQYLSKNIPPIYRPDASEFLDELHDLTSGNMAIVTNSNPQVIESKIATLSLNQPIKVIGGAKKYVVDHAWADPAVPLPTGSFTGYHNFPAEGINLQRPQFYTTLLEHGLLDAQRFVMVEDIFEFVAWIDYLILHHPVWANHAIALITSEMTPPWEKELFASSSDQRFSSTNLSDIYNWIWATS